MTEVCEDTDLAARRRTSLVWVLAPAGVSAEAVEGLTAVSQFTEHINQDQRVPCIVMLL